MSDKELLQAMSERIALLEKWNKELTSALNNEAALRINYEKMAAEFNERTLSEALERQRTARRLDETSASSSS